MHTANIRVYLPRWCMAMSCDHVRQAMRGLFWEQRFVSLHSPFFAALKNTGARKGSPANCACPAGPCREGEGQGRHRRVGSTAGYFPPVRATSSEQTHPTSSRRTWPPCIIALELKKLLVADPTGAWELTGAWPCRMPLLGRLHNNADFALRHSRLIKK